LSTWVRKARDSAGRSKNSSHDSTMRIWATEAQDIRQKHLWTVRL